MPRRVVFHSKRELVYNWDAVPVMVDIAWVARILGKTQDCLRKAAAAGRFPAHKVLGEWLIDKEELRAWLKGETVCEEK